MGLEIHFERDCNALPGNEMNHTVRLPIRRFSYVAASVKESEQSDELRGRSPTLRSTAKELFANMVGIVQKWYLCVGDTSICIVNFNISL
jgi:hypothetical protein